MFADWQIKIQLLGLAFHGSLERWISFRKVLQTSLSTLEKWADPLREQRLLVFRGK